MKDMLSRFFFRSNDFFRYLWRNTMGKINVIFWFLIIALNGMTTIRSISMGKSAWFNIFFLAIWMPGIIYWNYRMYKKARANGAKVKLAGEEFYNEWGEFDVKAAETDMHRKLKEMEDMISKNPAYVAKLSAQFRKSISSNVAAMTRRTRSKK